MATNPFIGVYKNQPEQNLTEDLIIESIKFYGHDMIYMPRETLDRDALFGDDIASQFKSNFMVEMYIDSIDGFEGADILSTIGIQIANQATFVISKRRFNETIYGKVRPMEGDLVYFPMTNGIFEINHVDHDHVFYNLGKLYTYKMTVELFSYSQETFDTGFTEIDRITQDRSSENEIARSDNKEIQAESDLVLDKSESGSDYPSTQDDTRWGDTDPFGGL